MATRNQTKGWPRALTPQAVPPVLGNDDQQPPLQQQQPVASPQGECQQQDPAKSQAQGIDPVQIPLQTPMSVPAPAPENVSQQLIET